MNRQAAPDKILIVDDEDNVRSLLLRHLEEEGSECVACPSALDALRQMKQEQFSLVISDIMMPGMSGMDFLRLAKKEDPRPFHHDHRLDGYQYGDRLAGIGACDFITNRLNC
jgi:CheY-like chemotaxis protein